MSVRTLAARAEESARAASAAVPSMAATLAAGSAAAATAAVATVLEAGPIGRIDRIAAALLAAGRGQAVPVLSLAAVALVSSVSTLLAVDTPQISIVGQPRVLYSNDSEDPDRERLRLDVGETEILFDDYLNPYARGYFALAIGEEGLELEEGFFNLFRGLPGEIAVRGGQFRAPMGRLNVSHPHTLPFAEPFELLGAYLPGEEAFIETGVELARRFAIAGETSLNAQLGWLQGNSFRVERESSGLDSDPLEAGGDDGVELTRPAVLGRLSGFGMVGEQSALEVGASFAHGTNNVDAATRTTLWGIDAKAKLWTGPRAYLLLQGELLGRRQEDAGWEADTGYIATDRDAVGMYLFADYNFDLRYNVGASVETFEEPDDPSARTVGFGLFAGLGLMEETTAIRLDWRRMEPEEGEGFDALTLRVIYSMGPHKAHQF